MTRRPLAAHRIVVAAALAFSIASCAGSDDSGPFDDVAGTNRGDPGSTPDAALFDELVEIGRVDIGESGNRVIDGPATLTAGDPGVAQLGGPVNWIVPARDADGTTYWLVTTGDQHQVALVDHDLAVFDTGLTLGADAAPPFGPPLGESPEPLEAFDDPIPHARVVERTDGAIAALTGPTDAYRHGVLGDAIEASAVTVIEPDGTEQTITIGDDRVIEAISPMFADVDGDGSDDLVVTLSDDSTGARLAVFDAHGELLTETNPVGRGNRWRNLLAVAPTGPSGEVEVIDVLTPHIGGVLQFFRIDPASGRLERVATTTGVTTHSIGSVNLDLGIVVDADGDGALDVVLPTQDRRTLIAVTRVDDEVDGSGTAEIFRRDLGGRITSNTSARLETDGTVSLAVGTDDGRLHVWPG